MSLFKKGGALLGVAIGLYLATATLHVTAATPDASYLLEVVVNGYPTGKIGEFVVRDDVLLAHPGELHELGFRVPDLILANPETLVSLSSLSGLTYKLDMPTQTVFMTAGSNLLLPTLLRAAQSTGHNIPVESGTGVSLNYDIVGNHSGSDNLLSGSFDLRAFSPYGVFSSELLAYRKQTSGPYKAVRLDSTYTFSDPDSLRQYRAGDFINDGLSWTRPIRLGGLQWRSDFALRPDLVTMPLPLVSGTVAVPSTIDVLVNGDRVFADQVQPGPFEIPQLPVVSGASTISVGVTNALGRQEVTTLSIYSSTGLLAPDLHSFSASLGFVRKNWGTVSSDYGELAGSATWRRGLSEEFTATLHAEGTSHLAMAGGGGNLVISKLGLLTVDVAVSAGEGRQGALVSLGMSRLSERLSFEATATLASSGFRDIAATSGDPVPTLRFNASVGLSLNEFGSVGLAYTAIERPGTPIKPPVPISQGVEDPISLEPAQKAQVLSASYMVQVRDASVYATAFRDFSNRGTGVLVGLTLPLGARGAIGAEVGTGSGGRYENVQANQSAAAIDDWGYQVYAADGTHSHQFAEVTYKSPYAQLFAGIDHDGGSTGIRVEAQGALSVVDGGLFAPGTIDDAFAVVDTSGVVGVLVLREHREVGRTNASGRLFVPDLRSFDVNHLEIDPTNVPADATLASPTRDVRPQDRSGIVVKFPIRTSHGALLRLVDDAGHEVPIGSAAQLKSTGVNVPVGYDGEAYIENLELKNELSISKPDGRRCTVNFDYEPIPGDIPTIGPLICHENGQ